LEIFELGATPDQAAWAQHNLGTVLTVLSEIEDSTEYLDQAFEAFRACLPRMQLDPSPEIRARARDGLTRVMVLLARRQPNSESGSSDT
jgi:hypothetical protein